MVPPSTELLPSAAPSSVHHFVATPRAGPGGVPDREALRELAGPGAPPCGVGRQAATGEAARPGHGRDLADPVHVRAGCRAAPQGTAQGDEDGDFRHRAQVGDVGVPHAVLGARLRRRGRGGL